MLLIVYIRNVSGFRLFLMEKPEVRFNVAQRIKELRREHGITQERFALMVGLNRSYLADIEKGHRNFGIDTLDKIVRGFNLSYEEFFKGL